MKIAVTVLAGLLLLRALSALAQTVCSEETLQKKLSVLQSQIESTHDVAELQKLNQQWSIANDAAEACLLQTLRANDAQWESLAKTFDVVNAALRIEIRRRACRRSIRHWRRPRFCR